MRPCRPPTRPTSSLHRLGQWIASLHPENDGAVDARWGRRVHLAFATNAAAGRSFELAAIWWMLPFAGVLSFLMVEELPYYRFMNASAAPIALVGLGSFAAIRWLLRGIGARRVVGAALSVAVVGAVVFLLVDGLQNRWVTDETQWATREVRVSLAAVHEVVEGRRSAPDRARRERRGCRGRNRHQHRLRLGEDLHQRVPHRDPRRCGGARGHVHGNCGELPVPRRDPRSERGLQPSGDGPLAGA